MKTKMRFSKVMSLFLLLGLMLSALNVGTVSAHHSTITGKVVCQTDGNQRIDWTIKNSESGKIETVTVLSRSIGLSVPFDIPKSGKVTGSELFSGSATGVITLSVTATWPGYGPVTNTGSVTLPGGCQPPEPQKVYVCKYVGTPGVNERLQDGNNPIEVSINSIPDYQGVGTYFGDAHARSYVLATVPQNPEPTRADCPQPPVYGCMDETALNYNPLATVDDGSCQYPPPPVPGCMDETALNYNPLATVDDGSCQYPPEEVLGCTDPEAINFNPLATKDDGSCQYTPEPPEPPIVVRVKPVCTELGCFGSNVDDTPADGECIATVITADDVCHFDPKSWSCVSGHPQVVLYCLNADSAVRMGGKYFETQAVTNADQPGWSILYTPLGAYRDYWFWLKAGLNPEMDDVEFWTNWQEKIFLTKSAPQYHGAACSLPVLYTVDGGYIELLPGQNSWEAIKYVVERQWGLSEDADSVLYHRAWSYVDQYFKDNPLTDPVRLWKHNKVLAPARPDWVPEP